MREFWRDVWSIVTRQHSTFQRPWRPQVGETVCDCAYQHLRVTKIDGDDATLENGVTYSIRYCLDPADHPPHKFVHLERNPFAKPEEHT